MASSSRISVTTLTLHAKLASVHKDLEDIIESHVTEKCEKLKVDHAAQLNALQDKMLAAHAYNEELSIENRGLKRKLETLETNTTTAATKPNDHDHRLLPHYGKSKVQRVTEREKHPSLIPTKSPIISSPSRINSIISRPTFPVVRQIFPVLNTDNNAVAPSQQAEPSKQSSSSSSAANNQFLCTDFGCGRQFATWQGLQVHKRTHTKVATIYPCPLCDNKFKRKADLDKHVRIHSAANKKFRCDQCGKMYSRQRDLDIHLRTHTATEKFICSKCGATFRNKTQHRVHDRDCED